MKEVVGDLWRYHAQGEYIVITTNGAVRRDGYAVMGRGLAFMSAQRCEGFQKAVGVAITQSGNHVYVFNSYRLITFPVKHHWKDRASIALIERSATELERLTGYDFQSSTYPVVYLPRVGCGNGLLTWSQVRPILQRTLLEDRFVVVTFPDDLLAPIGL